MGTGVQGKGIITCAMIPVMHAMKKAMNTLFTSEVLERHAKSEYLF